MISLRLLLTDNQVTLYAAVWAGVCQHQGYRLDYIKNCTVQKVSAHHRRSSPTQHIHHNSSSTPYLSCQDLEQVRGSVSAQTINNTVRYGTRHSPMSSAKSVPRSIAGFSNCILPVRLQRHHTFPFAIGRLVQNGPILSSDVS